MPASGKRHLAACSTTPENGDALIKPTSTSGWLDLLENGAASLRVLVIRDEAVSA